ncbi:hypothetical protein SSABA_v1c02030 [Spiroplasma sabaudiense Ar-1343]|uniref:Uncharacterized protein n=1 Tax=Spiroplasma sabaudiense Ar-1343 TaxID=1276257 RepID=W6A9Q5_9MOLU|nr:hypothetical protein [Spiroplasma sabaudiense]AHI53615.1 hypothetical protein SSABA_v1c02030 [Spiroplasma sabaudiense Ar-1343]
MQNELKTARINRDSTSAFSPNKAFFKFILRLMKRSKKYFIFSFLVALFFAAFPSVYFIFIFKTVEPSVETATLFGSWIISMWIASTLIGSSVFFQKIYLENRNTAVFKRVALTGISKNNFLRISYLVMTLYAIIPWIFSTIIALIFSLTIIGAQGTSILFFNYSFLTGVLTLMAALVASTGLGFWTFSSVSSFSVSRICYSIFLSFSVIIVQLKNFIPQEAWLLADLLILASFLILMILFWSMAIKKFQYYI